ncbi:MAG: transposase [Clostridia bacterium]|nr:transposase [Clostridia bacterium]
MPRYARTISQSQTYHVMLRGNNKEPIFIDDDDKNRIVDTIFDKKSNGAFLIYAYCIMDNHLHIVIKEGEDSLSRAIKRIATSYAYYFNKKYKRVGHVFQDRYKSECVENDAYLLSVIRYVHQNPWKAGIGTIGDYKWSSYNAYFKGSTTMHEVADILSMISTLKRKSLSEFARFTHEKADEIFVDVGEEKELNEDNVRDYIESYLQEKKLSLRELSLPGNKEIREHLVKILADSSSLSKRGIANVLGLNREMVRVICQKNRPFDNGVDIL